MPKAQEPQTEEVTLDLGAFRAVVLGVSGLRILTVELGFRA